MSGSTFKADNLPRGIALDYSIHLQMFAAFEIPESNKAPITKPYWQTSIPRNLRIYASSGIGPGWNGGAMIPPRDYI